MFSQPCPSLSGCPLAHRSLPAQDVSLWKELGQGFPGNKTDIAVSAYGAEKDQRDVCQKVDPSSCPWLWVWCFPQSVGPHWPRIHACLWTLNRASWRLGLLCSQEWLEVDLSSDVKVMGLGCYLPRIIIIWMTYYCFLCTQSYVKLSFPLFGRFWFIGLYVKLIYIWHPVWFVSIVVCVADICIIADKNSAFGHVSGISSHFAYRSFWPHQPCCFCVQGP